MRRKYTLGLFSLLCVILTSAAIGQENLDTLWTRQIGGDGNDVFLDVSKTEYGNVLVVAYLTEWEGRPAGTYAVEITPEGDFFAIVPLSVFPSVASFSSLRQTEDGGFVATSKWNYYRLDTDGELLESRVMGENFDRENYGNFPSFDYEHIGRTAFTSGSMTDSVLWISGNGIDTGILGHIYWFYSGGWLARFLLASDTRRELCFPCNALMTDANHYLRLDTNEVGDSITVVASQLSADDWHAETGWSFTIASDADAYGMVINPRGGYWYVGRTVMNVNTLSPFYAYHLGSASLTAVRDSLGPAPYAFGFDSFDNLVALGYSDAILPDRGMRFDLISPEFGGIQRPSVVNSLSEHIARDFVMLDDNTAIVVSSTTTHNDLVITRTDTLPSQVFVPTPSSLELLVAGPPAWGYRLSVGSFPQETIILDNICSRATVSLSGAAADHWDFSRQNSRVFFTAIDRVSPNTSVDTLWLIAPECLGGTLIWTIDSSFGEIEGPYIPDGPYFPEGYVQQFMCRLERTGVSVRFAMSDALDIDVVKVWRKQVGSADSAVVGSVNAYPGQYVILDEGVAVNRMYEYYLLAVDDFGRIWKVPEASATVYVDGTVVLPTEFDLSPAYPNPFNAVTSFDYALPYQTNVSFRIYDITGRQVATLVDGFKEAGTYSVVFDASRLATGIYVYSFDAWNFSAHGKVLLLK